MSSIEAMKAARDWLMGFGDPNKVIADLDAAIKAAQPSAIKEERLALARECVEAWENAVDWASYASDYFREKHSADKDQDRLDEARYRLAMLDVKQPSAISDERDYKALYLDLIMQVAKKYPGETRHDTAKKYIRFCETPIGEGRDQAAAQEGK